MPGKGKNKMRMKTKYIIDYGDGNQVAIMAGSIGEAMKKADEKMRLTECHILILDSNGMEICRRQWYKRDTIHDENPSYSGDCTLLIHAGKYGVYTSWELAKNKDLDKANDGS